MSARPTNHYAQSLPMSELLTKVAKEAETTQQNIASGLEHIAELSPKYNNCEELSNYLHNQLNTVYEELARTAPTGGADWFGEHYRELDILKQAKNLIRDMNVPMSELPTIAKEKAETAQQHITSAFERITELAANHNNYEELHDNLYHQHTTVWNKLDKMKPPSGEDSFDKHYHEFIVTKQAITLLAKGARAPWSPSSK